MTTASLTILKNILENAGEDYEFKVRNFEDDSMYIMACTFILGFVYDFNIDIKRPFYFDIPDKVLRILILETSML